jgi:hypothetical protein
LTAAHAERVARHLDRPCTDRGTQSTARTMTRSVPPCVAIRPSATWSAASSTRRAVAAPNTEDQTPARYLAGPHSAPKGGRADAQRVERSSSERSCRAACGSVRPNLRRVAVAARCYPSMSKWHERQISVAVADHDYHLRRTSPRSVRPAQSDSTARARDDDSDDSLDITL